MLLNPITRVQDLLDRVYSPDTTISTLALDLLYHMWIDAGDTDAGAAIQFDTECVPVGATLVPYVSVSTMLSTHYATFLKEEEYDNTWRSGYEFVTDKDDLPF